MNTYNIKYLSVDQSSIKRIVIKANTPLLALDQMPDHYRLLEVIVEAQE